MMNQVTYGPKSILPLSLAGLISSLLWVTTGNFLPSVARWAGGEFVFRLAEPFYEGTIFGVSIAAYFVLREGSRSVGRAVIFSIACVAANWASVFASFWVHGRLPHAKLTFGGGSSHLGIPLPVFFCGGFVGSFVVLAAALFLFDAGDTVRRSIGKVLLCASGGGLLGVVGWASGPLLGGALWLGLKGIRLIPASETYELAVAQDKLGFLALPVVWQTGVGFLLGMMLSSENATWAMRASLELPAKPARPKALKIAAIVFFGGVFALFGWQVSRIFRGQMALKREEDALRTMLAEAPSRENLPSIEPLPAEKVLLVEQIGGLFPSEPRVLRLPLGPTGDPPKPQSIEYSMSYSPINNKFYFAATIIVSVQEFPNTEWAVYRAKYPAFNYPPGGNAQSRSTPTKFGNKIVIDAAGQYLPANQGRLYVLWPSGNAVVTIRSEIGEVNEKILRRYLEKYPSSL